MSEPYRIRILAVDDHQLIRTGIATLLLPETDMELVGEASDGREAVAKFRECRPDITLMDLQMPEMNGLDAILAIREQFPDARIIVLTTYAGFTENSSKPSAWFMPAGRLCPRKSPRRLRPTPARSCSRRARPTSCG
jgi:chemotaxis response regulator CheB